MEIYVLESRQIDKWISIIQFSIELHLQEVSVEIIEFNFLWEMSFYMKIVFQYFYLIEMNYGSEIT